MQNAKSLYERVRRGETRAVARAATLIENRTDSSRELLRQLFPEVGRARIIGITGSPGAGKSTLTAALVAAYRKQDMRVAVIAVDPSSPFSGGAILGDRIRMLEHHGDSGVYIRSMATRGSMGGLAPATFDLCVLLDAAGFDCVLVETVGVGQDEVDVARLADCTIVVLAPGMGDDVQAIKAGLLEIADIYALNKADLEGIDRLERDMRAMLELTGRTSPVVRVIASQREGVTALMDALKGAPPRPEQRVRKWIWRLQEMYRERLLARLEAGDLSSAARQVAEGSRDPYTVIEEWLARPLEKTKEN